MFIVCLEFFVVLLAAVIGLLVYKRLIRSPKFSQIVTEIVEPPEEADVIADLDLAKVNAEHQIKVNKIKAAQAEDSTKRIRRRLS